MGFTDVLETISKERLPNLKVATFIFGDSTEEYYSFSENINSPDVFYPLIGKMIGFLIQFYDGKRTRTPSVMLVFFLNAGDEYLPP